ncbi:hypothetical protein HDU67_009293, partial [Dinochytrium kinnereticum]
MKREMAQVRAAQEEKKSFYEQYSHMIAPGTTSNTNNPSDTDDDNDDDDNDNDYTSDAAGLLLSPPTNAISSSSNSRKHPTTTTTTPDDDDDDADDFNAETMLYAAADDVYFSTKRKRSLATMKSTFMSTKATASVKSGRSSMGPAREVERNLFRRIRGWYTPVYDYRSPNVSEEERRRPRFFGGTLRKWQFVMMHVTAFFGLAMLVMIPIAYFIIIPNIIQDVLDKTGMESVTLSTLSVDTFSTTQIGFYVKAQIPPPTIFPLRAGVGDLTLNIHDEQENILMKALIPSMDFTLNQVVRLDTRGNVSFDGVERAAIVKLVKEFSTTGLKERVFMMRARVQIKVFGITVYPGLPIRKAFPITGISNDIVKLYGSLPSFTRVPANEMNLLQNAYAENPDQLITFTNSTLFPPLALHTFSLTPTETGFTLTLSIEFQNPTRMTLSNFQSAEFGFTLEGVPLARVEVSNLSLRPALQTLEMSVGVVFDVGNPEGVAGAFGRAFEKALGGREGEIGLGVVGPLKVRQVGVVESFTGDFLVNLPGADIINSLNTDAVRALLTPTGLSTILSNTTLSALVDSTNIRIDTDIGLPRFFPLPPTITFPFTTSLGMYGSPSSSPQKILDMKVGDVVITTTKNRIGVKTSVDVALVNSGEAADALAGIVNPLLAASPKSSVASFGDIAILKTPTNEAYEWTRKLFAGNLIPITLPSGLVSTTSLIDILTQNETSIPLTIRRLDVTQLSDVKGFGAKGNVGVRLPPSLEGLAKNVTVDIGYAGVRMLVDGMDLGNAELGSGIRVPAAEGVDNFDARVIVADGSAGLTVAVQRLVDSVVATVEGRPLDGAGSSSVGVTGVRFGASRETSFVTFSKILAEIPASHVMPLLNRTLEGLKRSVLVPGTVRVDT